MGKKTPLTECDLTLARKALKEQKPGLKCRILGVWLMNLNRLHVKVIEKGKTRAVRIVLAFPADHANVT
jgi:hypothetical protein